MHTDTQTHTQTQSPRDCSQKKNEDTRTGTHTNAHIRTQTFFSPTFCYGENERESVGDTLDLDPSGQFAFLRSELKSALESNERCVCVWVCVCVCIVCVNMY